ncbi:MAG TPA: hypothetical protein VFR27_05210 [Mycobacterium sp.]|nr:hypothetical protein [Mycobacterium sp.]
MPDQTFDNPEVLAQTEPHHAPIFDTGPHPLPLPGLSVALAEADGAGPDSDSGPARASSAPQPRSVPSVLPPASGQYQFLSWWKLVLTLAAVWVPAGAIGLGLFSWWHAVADKTPAVFVTLIYVVACTVVGLMLASSHKPVLAALAMAVMSAVFASMVAAAPLYGHYYCQVKGPCLVGIIPY